MGLVVSTSVASFRFKFVPLPAEPQPAALNFESLFPSRPATRRVLFLFILAVAAAAVLIYNLTAAYFVIEYICRT